MLKSHTRIVPVHLQRWWRRQRFNIDCLWTLTYYLAQKYWIWKDDKKPNDITEQRHTEWTVTISIFPLFWTKPCVLDVGAERQISDLKTLIIWHFSLFVTRLWRDHLYLHIYNLNVRAIYGVDRTHSVNTTKHAYRFKRVPCFDHRYCPIKWMVTSLFSGICNKYLDCVIQNTIETSNNNKNCRRIRRHDVLLFNRTAIKLNIRSHSSWLGCI